MELKCSVFNPRDIFWFNKSSSYSILQIKCHLFQLIKLFIKHQWEEKERRKYLIFFQTYCSFEMNLTLTFQLLIQSKGFVFNIVKLNGKQFRNINQKYTGINLKLLDLVVTTTEASQQPAAETENITIIPLLCPSHHFMRDFSARKCIK